MGVLHRNMCIRKIFANTPNQQAVYKNEILLFLFRTMKVFPFSLRKNLIIIIHMWQKFTMGDDLVFLPFSNCTSFSKVLFYNRQGVAISCMFFSASSNFLSVYVCVFCYNSCTNNVSLFFMIFFLTRKELLVNV